MRTLLEQKIARTQGALVGPEVFPVARVALAPEKVEKAAALRRGAADQFDVLIGKESNQAVGQVFVRFALGNIVEHKPPPFVRRVVADQLAPTDPSAQRESRRPMPHGLAQGTRAGGLQTEQNADRFEQG